MDDYWSRIFRSHRSVWQILNCHVLSNGPTKPSKLMRSACQVFYSKLKGGVDEVTQLRSILRSSTCAPQWEFKFVLQVMKTIIINSFLTWTFMPLDSKNIDNNNIFQRLNGLKNFQCFADFVPYAVRKLLFYANTIFPVIIRTQSSSLGTHSGSRSAFHVSNSAEYQKLRS